MLDEYSALITTGTWDLVPRPMGVNVVNCMWLFRHKEKSDGALEMHKALLVCDGRSQEVGVDCDETFSPVETVYMHQPPGFVDRQIPQYVCRLKKALYGLKQAPKECLREHIITQLQTEFPMTDLGPLSYFLGIVVTRTPSYLLLSQQKYAQEILDSACMSNCKPVVTPVDTNSKLSADSGPPVHDPTHYRSLVGALQYLTFTRPDIAYAVQQVCLFMHDPRESHFNALKRILRYIQGTIDHGLHLYPSASTRLITYTDADWGGCLDTRCSTSGYCCFLGDNLISRSSKRQHTLSRSSAEAKYRGVANIVAEACWLRNLLLELHCPLK
ncbi:uncharacterized mitochondrial protein AtMg00810-like [Beta vulgaris subsp. vulgaris]|uniref:uncharacterized mitochondrial protein AtMg00810-like n=1 Tax=Beta vulgaris subsp. vulgaris TaxID=3555 RepID=UPI000900A762|nr:uncharacterized mitochondrial protein AtMg00810-like [Beta vulgaris subsp. vulgaris]